MNKKMMNKVAKEIEKIKKADRLFTDALIDLEALDYDEASPKINSLLYISTNIEQRAGAMFLHYLCMQENDELTLSSLVTIYKTGGR